MVCARVHRIGRAFAFVLLLGTAADLVNHTLCGPGPAEAAGNPAVFAVPTSPTGHSDVPYADHSFCCSHTVDVQTPFEIAVTPLPVGLTPADSPALPFRDPSRLLPILPRLKNGRNVAAVEVRSLTAVLLDSIDRNIRGES